MDRLGVFMHHNVIGRYLIAVVFLCLSTACRVSVGSKHILCQTVPTRILVERINQGDNDAIDALYRRYSPIVVMMARANLGPGQNNNTFDAEDVAQSVLMNSLGDLENFEYRHEGAFRHLLSCRVRHKVIDKKRQQNARRRQPDQPTTSDETNIPDRDARRASQIVSNEEQYELLNRALATLKEGNEEHWDIIEKRMIDKLTFPQIGDLLGISSDAARMRFDRAMPRLIEIFHSLGGGNG